MVGWLTKPGSGLSSANSANFRHIRYSPRLRQCHFTLKVRLLQVTILRMNTIGKVGVLAILFCSFNYWWLDQNQQSLCNSFND